MSALAIYRKARSLKGDIGVRRALENQRPRLFEGVDVQ
jgi:hypothetical protein